MLVTSARLRRLTLALWDLPFLVMMAAAVGASLTLRLDATAQTFVAGAVIVYACARAAQLFFRTVAAARRG